MRILTSILLIAAFGIAASANVATAQASANCATLAEAKRKTYGFHPSTLSASERMSKTAAMDQFWNLAKAEGPEGLACVANLIADEKTDTWFLFDAATLLVTFDQSGKSDSAIVSALSRTDLAEVEPPAFIQVALQVSKRGGDIGPAAHNYMNAANVTADLPAHGGYRLDRTAGAIVLYGRMPADAVDKYLAMEVTSKNLESRDAAAIVWSLNMTESSFKGLAALGDMANFSNATREHVRSIRRYVRVPVTRPPKYTREQVLQKITKWPELSDTPTEQAALDNACYATLTPADLSTIREARRRLIAGVSDEAIEGYNEASHLLMNMINVLDAYKEYRVH